MQRLNALMVVGLATGVFGTACGRDDRDDDAALAASLELIDDPAALGARVTALEQLVVVEGLELSGKPVATPFSLTIVARIAPPVVGSSTLQATKVVLMGKRAYVSYNLAGEPQAGAIDVIDVSGPRPRLTTQLVSKDADVNALAVEPSALYAVGARAGKAFARRIELKNSELTVEARDVELPSFAGTSAALSNGLLHATSGSDGGLTILKKNDLARSAQIPLTDARDVAAVRSGNGTVVVAGTPGRIAAFDKNGVLSGVKDIGGATITESKSTVESGKYTTLVALGDGGMRLYCGAGESLLAEVPAVVMAGVPPAQTVTNSASASGALLFTANGEAGVRVYAVRGKKNNDKCEPVELPLLGALNFGAKLSANGATYDGTFLYVATGLGGLEIVRVDGTKAEDGDSDEFAVE